MNKTNWFDKLTQVMLPITTILGFTLTSMKKPELGLIFNLASEIFWLYSGYKAWKTAGQIGIFITTIIISIIVLYGVLNYWVL
ncbi:MAG: hypothetical protein WBO77_05195 [Microgenomates group bacterium]